MQVSHHPPILAFQSESTEGSYKLYGEIEIKNKFWGRSIEVRPPFSLNVLSSNSVYLYCITNLITCLAGVVQRRCAFKNPQVWRPFHLEPSNSLYS